MCIIDNITKSTMSTRDNTKITILELKCAHLEKKNQELEKKVNELTTQLAWLRRNFDYEVEGRRMLNESIQMQFALISEKLKAAEERLDAFADTQ